MLGGSLAFLNVQAAVTLGAHSEVAGGCEQLHHEPSVSVATLGNSRTAHTSGLHIPQCKLSHERSLPIWKGCPIQGKQKFLYCQTLWRSSAPGKFLKRWEYQMTLPVSWETCMWTWRNGLVHNRERSMTRLYLVTFSVNFCAEYIMQNDGLNES